MMAISKYRLIPRRNLFKVCPPFPELRARKIAIRQSIITQGYGRDNIPAPLFPTQTEYPNCRFRDRSLRTPAHRGDPQNVFLVTDKGQKIPLVSRNMHVNEKIL